MGGATEAVEGHIPFTPLARQVLERTATEALGLGHNYIGCEHILLGLLAVDDGLASQVLRRVGLDYKTTKPKVITALMGFVHARGELPSMQDVMRRLDAIEERLKPESP